VTVLAALALVALAILARQIERSWLSPGAFYAGFWAALTVVTLVLAPELPVSGAGLWWIVLSTFYVVLGSWIALRLGGRPAEASCRPTATQPALARTVAVLSGVGLLAPWFLLQSQGESLSVLFSASNLAQVGRDFSIARYAGSYTPPISVNVCIVAIYAAAMLGGCLLGQSSASVRRRAVGLLPLIPVAGVTLVETAKAPLYITLVLLASGFLITRSGSARLSWRALLLVIAVLAFVIPGSVLVNLNRYGGSVSNSLDVSQTTDRIHNEALGSLPAFTYWFDHGAVLQQGQLAWGTSSFFGPSAILTSKPRISGVYSDYVTFPSGLTSNVYTLYRGLIEDFSLPGSLVVLFLFGLLARLAYVRAKAGGVLAATFLCAFYAVTLWGFVINVFGYDTVIGSLLVFLLYQLISQRGRLPRQAAALRAPA
jgi:oligosaccharide repeat unit polymerase